MQTVRGAVLDVGSNSVKFLVAEQRGRTLHILHERAFTTRLGDRVETTGRLSRRGIRDTLAVVAEARGTAHALGATRWAAVGTSALRTAANADDFLTPARGLLGRRIAVISGRREGLLAYSGIASSPAWADRRVLAMDLGGGSIEFVLGQAGKIERCRSLPLGCVRLRDLFLARQPVGAEAQDEARAYLLDRLRPVLPWFQERNVMPVGSGGTMFTLTALHLDPAAPPDPDRCEGRRVPAAAVARIARSLAVMELEEIRALRAVPPSRADVITAGALVYDTVLRATGARFLGCATLGLRYGLWQEALAPLRFQRITRET